MSIVADDFAGRLIITWPKGRDGRPLPGFGIAVTDADTNEPIVSALDLTVHVDLNSVITAEMTMLANEDGKPLLGRIATAVPGPDGQHFLTGRFRWIVTEMRTAN